jgi:hypothetical protein
MNQGPRYVHLMEKSRGQKSRATVPLSDHPALPLVDIKGTVAQDFWALVFFIKRTHLKH